MTQVTRVIKVMLDQNEIFFFPQGGFGQSMVYHSDSLS